MVAFSTHRDAKAEAGAKFVSVIVPVYNGQDTIGQCIEALLAQDWPQENFEVIVVDNNSTDRTVQVVSQYPVTLVHESAIQTSYAARNRGVRAARGDIVAFTDADCFADEAWLRRLVEPFSDPAVGAVAGTVQSYASSGLVERFFAAVRPFDPSSAESLKSLLTGNIAYRKHLVEDLGLFDETLFTAGDVDLGWRVQIWTKAQVRRVPDAVVYHRFRSTRKGLFDQYRRYGFSEILLDTLYRGSPFHKRTPARQLRIMVRQVRALFTYIGSMVYRRLRNRLDRVPIADAEFYLAFPVLFFIAESGALLGKCDALIATRGFRRTPFPSRPEIRRK